MAIRVSVSGRNTIVKKVTVGVPIRKVSSSGGFIKTLGDVDLTNLSDGALLVYNGSTENFDAKTNINNTNTDLNGGNF
jgi:hypothetical protein